MPAFSLRRISSRASTVSVASSEAPPPYASTDALAGSSSSASPPQAPAASPVDATVFPPEGYSVRFENHPVLLTNTVEIKAHLRLLSAFHALEQTVSSSHAPLAAQGEADGEKKAFVELSPRQRWAFFVQVAVYRFEVYVKKLEGRVLPVGAAQEAVETPKREALEKELEEKKKVVDEVGVPHPPLDVALVLNTYLLNPRRFAEDAMLKLPQLRLFANMPLEQIAEAISPLSFTYHPPAGEAEAWEKLTGLPFDPLPFFTETKGREIFAPKSGLRTFVPWLTPEGTGYAQEHFRFKTEHGETCTHELLGLARLSEDLCAVSNWSFWSLKQMAEAPCLPGTVLSSLESPENASDSFRAQFVRGKIRQSGSPLAKLETKTAAAARMGWTRGGARRLLEKAIGEDKKRCVSNILACYPRGEPFGIDLGAAVLRQGTFIAKMHRLGWLAPSRFADDDALLHRCVARYHGFLQLLEAQPHVFCVPTLDIDLAWHTHQLTSRYRGDVRVHVGRFLDHDDKVEENRLSDSFEATARAWQSRFGVPYSTCGCPIPSAPSFAKLGKAFGRSSKASAAPPSPFASAPVDEPDSNPSHPSDHNALVLLHSTEAKQRTTERRREADTKMARLEREKLKKGGGKIGEKETVEGRRAHQAAFFAPIALVAVVGAGVALSPAAGCVPVAPHTSASAGSGTCGTAGGACVPSLGCGAGGSCGTCAVDMGDGGGGGGCGGGCGGGD
ncbi:hypothetical protein JCM6882_007968 [Rhodosporidiobolus microsporus]